MAISPPGELPFAKAHDLMKSVAGNVFGDAMRFILRAPGTL